MHLDLQRSTLSPSLLLKLRKKCEDFVTGLINQWRLLVSYDVESLLSAIRNTKPRAGETLWDFTDNLHQFQQVEKPNPPAPFPGREGGVRYMAPLLS